MAEATETLYSLIIPCYGRWEHARRAWRSWIPWMNRESEVVFVDYSCPEHSGGHLYTEYIKEERIWDKMRFVSASTVPGSLKFNLSRARNMGALAARGRVLIHCDCDMLLSQELYNEIDRKYRFEAKDQSRFFMSFGRHVNHAGPGYNGFLVVPHDVFWSFGGYPVHFKDYGYYDTYMLTKLNELNLDRLILNPKHAQHIEHDDAVRTKHYEQKDTGLSMKLNSERSKSV